MTMRIQIINYAMTWKKFFPPVYRFPRPIILTTKI